MDVLPIIRQFLQERLNLDPETVVPEALLKDLGVDSLTLLELLFECEEKLNINISEDTSSPTTVAELISIVEKFPVPPSNG